MPDDDEMEIDVVNQAPAKRKTTKKTKPDTVVPPTVETSKAKSSKSKSKGASELQIVPKPKRKYIPTVDVESEEDNAPEKHVDIPAKPVEKASNVSDSTTGVPDKPRRKPKKAVKVDGDDDDSDAGLSQSENSDLEPEYADDTASLSGDDDALDLDAERAQIISTQGEVEDDLQFDYTHIPHVRHQRQSSSSSRGSMPPDTDFDNAGTSSAVDDEDEEDDEDEPVRGYSSYFC
ncbi:hypothetical protein C8R44DRAFT_813639 [Mycena epipterygia]|nr:hypothetical protein C8R44DRAFT_813639 [Mycena epipterygia]